MTRLLAAIMVMMLPIPQGQGRIVGKVVSTDAAERPIARAYIVMTGDGATLPRFTMSNADGEFVFDGLPPGQYMVVAGKLPHIAASAGAQLTSAQQLASLRLPLARAGAISGYVFDATGQPARNASVSARQILYDRRGVRSTARAVSATTDRSGRYRLHGLRPGSYVVGTATNSFSSSMAQRLSDDAVDRVMQGIIQPPPPTITAQALATAPGTTFVPGTFTMESATVFLIWDGTEHLNANVHVTEPRVGSISGTIVGPDGMPASASITVRDELEGTSGSYGFVGSTRQGAGRFSVERLVPGRYHLEAKGDGQLRASVVVAVDGNTIGDIALTLQLPATLTGTIAKDSRPGPYTLELRRVDGVREAIQHTVGASGPFTFCCVAAGRYVFAPGALVTINGRDMTDRVFDIDGRSPLNGLVLSFVDVGQQIEGRVVNPDGQGVDTVVMLAFSVHEGDWFTRSQRITMAKPDGAGRYQLGGAGAPSLPPGDYYLAAVADLHAGEHYNPAFLKELIPAAIKITLGVGERKVQDVRVQ